MSDIEEQRQTPLSPSEQRLRRFVAYSVVTLVVIIGILCLIGAVAMGLDGTDFWAGFIRTQFQVVVGLPMAAVAAFVIVLVLEVTTGSIEFEGLGFKFKGASGPVILWLLCFLGIAAAIKMLWISN